MVHKAKKAGLTYHVESPSPWFFEKEFIDGGLLIVSRFPIIDSHFHAFTTPSYLTDCIVKKGLLYAKIDISEAGGSFLHLFNTHTQATESELALEPYVYSFVARYE